MVDLSPGALRVGPYEVEGSLLRDLQGVAASLRSRRRGLSIALSGPDGSGKSSLAAAIARLLFGAGVPAHVCHRFRWADHLLRTPWDCLLNRYWTRHVVIYDRCYLDNVATLSLRGVPPWLLRALAAVWRSATFGLDRVICLEATPDELYRRRPETPRRQLERLRAAYSGLGSRWVAPLRSDSQALTRASRIVMSLSTPARPEVAAPAAPGAAPGCQQPGGTEPAGLFEEQWRARFERFARTYQNEALISGWSPEGLRRRLALFEALLPALGLPERCRALDLGCGGGSYVRLLAGLGHRVVGLDYSVPSLERARAADPGGKGRYLAGEAYALPVAGASLDLVVSIGVLQALGDPEAALAEMARVLRPGGVLVVEALNAGSAPDRLRRALRRLRGEPERVRTYRLRRVRGWLAGLGFQVMAEAGLVLPPRRRPGLARLLDARPVAWTLNAVPGLAALAAHSVLFVCRRGAPAGVPA